MEDNTKRRRIRAAYAVPLAILAAVALCMTAAAAAAVRSSGLLRLYREIGATPWHRPKTNISSESSERYSDEEIRSAIDAALDTYERDWYSYNGTYLLELSYDDEFSENRQDENEGDWIYLRSVMFTGYDKEILPENRGVYHDDAYWAAERQADGSWICRGCGQI